MAVDIFDLLAGLFNAIGTAAVASVGRLYGVFAVFLDPAGPLVSVFLYSLVLSIVFTAATKTLVGKNTDGEVKVLSGNALLLYLVYIIAMISVFVWEAQEYMTVSEGGEVSSLFGTDLNLGGLMIVFTVVAIVCGVAISIWFTYGAAIQFVVLGVVVALQHTVFGLAPTAWSIGIPLFVFLLYFVVVK